MNRTKIDWPWKPLWTWNPITGCENECFYCYARKIANRFPDNYGGPGFKPTIHADRLDEPHEHKNPLHIFVGSMADMWGEWVSKKWIEKVLVACKCAPQHVYIFLTKNPERYSEFSFEGLSVWLGCTITATDIGRQRAMCYLKRDEHFQTFCSAEPLLGKISNPVFPLEKAFDRIIVGAMSGSGAVSVKQEWIDSIKHPNVYYKNSIKGGVR
jgi:protein gp37